MMSNNIPNYSSPSSNSSSSSSSSSRTNMMNMMNMNMMSSGVVVVELGPDHAPKQLIQKEENPYSSSPAVLDTSKLAAETTTNNVENTMAMKGKKRWVLSSSSLPPNSLNEGLGSSTKAKKMSSSTTTTTAAAAAVLEKMKRWTVRMHGILSLWKVGKEDPRRVVHSIKVGLALTVLSLICLLEPLFHGFGENAIWAVLTVILIFEFTAGGTLYKGLNRGIGTLCALFFAFIVKIIAQNLGRTGCAVLIGVSVFVIGMSTTYMRFFPSVKKHYDQGAIVFLVTYNLITLSGYHDQNMWNVVFQRLYVIAIGFGLCIIMSILILPNWSGQELQNSIISKIDVLAKSISDVAAPNAFGRDQQITIHSATIIASIVVWCCATINVPLIFLKQSLLPWFCIILVLLSFLSLAACVNEYFQEPDIKGKNEDASKDIDGGYEAALECKTADEALATFASWEPRHSRYCYPWQQYVQLGKVLRHLGYTAISLHGCLEAQIQTPQSVRTLFKQPCEHVAEEVAKVLRELADSIRKHCHCSPHIADDLHGALQDLDVAIKSQPRLFLCSKPSMASRTDAMDFLRCRSKKAEDLSRDPKRKSIHRSLSKIAITSLEFAEALPFAAFASLLVEMALRLELVIEEVEELGRIAHFKEYHEEPNIKINITGENTESSDAHEPQTSHTLSAE